MNNYTCFFFDRMNIGDNPFLLEKYFMYIKNILKLSTLGCALAMITFNSCYAMDVMQNKQYKNITKSYAACDDSDISPDVHLKLAKNNMSHLESAINSATIYEDDGIPSLQKYNNCMLGCKESMKKIYNYTIDMVTKSELLDIMEYIQVHCIAPLNDALQQLKWNKREEENNHNINIIKAREQAIRTAKEYCENISYNLRQYRDKILRK